MARHQQGHIYRKNGWWMLRYRDWVIEDGVPVWKHTTPRRLAPVCDRFRSKGSVRPIADELLLDVNSGLHVPEAAITLAELIEQRYFPWVETQVRKSTLESYRDIWRLHFKPRCSRMLIRDFRPAD